MTLAKINLHCNDFFGDHGSQNMFPYQPTFYILEIKNLLKKRCILIYTKLYKKNCKCL